MQKMIAVLCLLFELSPINKFVEDIIYTWLLIINFGSGDLPSPLMDIFDCSMKAFGPRREKLSLGSASIKGSDQPGHLCSLISTFDISSFESITSPFSNFF